jgi:myo-inositol catabolism protein IolC
MALGYDGRLFMLAFDHRDAFREILPPERIPEAKRIVFDGFLRALERTPSDAAAILVDEELGADIAREARALGVALAMPVERSGTGELDFEYGAAYREHVVAFEPTLAKALVRYDPDGEPALNARQAGRLRELSDWLHAEGRKLLLEVLVPGGERSAERIVEAMRQLQEAGVEPDVWKLEGLDRPEHCLRVSEQARVSGRDRVVCLVLGAGAEEGTVVRWLQAAARTPGYAGFAVGRTIWWQAVSSWAREALPRERATAEIAARYQRMVEAYG